MDLNKEEFEEPRESTLGGALILFCIIFCLIVGYMIGHHNGYEAGRENLRKVLIELNSNKNIKTCQDAK